MISRIKGSTGENPYKVNRIEPTGKSRNNKDREPQNQAYERRYHHESGVGGIIDSSA